MFSIVPIRARSSKLLWKIFDHCPSSVSSFARYQPGNRRARVAPAGACCALPLRGARGTRSALGRGQERGRGYWRLQRLCVCAAAAAGDGDGHPLPVVRSPRPDPTRLVTPWHPSQRPYSDARARQSRLRPLPPQVSVPRASPPHRRHICRISSHSSLNTECRRCEALDRAGRPLLSLLSYTGRRLLLSRAQ